MTDRLHSLQVTLDRNIRADDADKLIAAISQMRGVISVDGLAADPAYWAAQTRAKQELAVAIHEILVTRKDP